MVLKNNKNRVRKTKKVRKSKKTKIRKGKYKTKKRTNKRKTKKIKNRKTKKKSGFLKISNKKFRGNIHTHRMDCVPCVLHHMGMDEELARLISQPMQNDNYEGKGFTEEKIIEILEWYYKDYLFFIDKQEFKDSEEMFLKLFEVFEKMKNNMHIIAILHGYYNGKIWKHAVVLMKYKNRPIIIDVQNKNLYEYEGIPDYLEKCKVNSISLLDSKHRITGERLVIQDKEIENKKVPFYQDFEKGESIELEDEEPDWLNPDIKQSIF